MTFADDFALEGVGEQPEYPSLFGVSITPAVSGVLCALLGLAGGAALGMYLVKPAWENLQAKEEELATIQGKIDGLQAAQQEISRLVAEKQQLDVQKQEILSLFASEDKLDTYLYDLAEQFEDRSGLLLKFTPVTSEESKSADATVVENSDWGESANGLLKTKKVDIAMAGDFNKTQSILRSIEQLQLLSVVKNFNSAVQGEQTLSYDAAKSEFVPSGSLPILATTLTLETIVPRSDKELEEAAKAQAAAAEAEAAAAEGGEAEAPAE